MSLRSKGIITALVVLSGLLLWAPTDHRNLHSEIQQRLLEAELGSATTFHFAAGSRAMVPDDKTTDTLLGNLESSSPKIRWQAAKQLAVRRNPLAVEAIIHAMRDPGGTLRVCVMASALGHLKDPRALSALTEAAFDPGNRDLRLCAIQSLGMIGDRAAVPTLIEALKNNNMPIAAANAIARMGDERGVMPIIQAAHDPQKQLWMVMALGELGSPAAKPYLQSIETEQKASIRHAAQEALWKIDQLESERKVAALSEVLTHARDDNSKMWAAFRLGELKQVEAIPALIQALDDESQDVQGRSAAALIRIGEKALPELRAQVQSGSASGRLYAAAILGYLGSPGDIPLLQDIARQKDQGMMTNVAHQSVELINRFSKSKSGFTNLATIEHD